jgi:hypothetical protein
MWRVRGRGEVCTGFRWGNLRERDHLGDPDVDGRIILRWIFRKWRGGGCGDWMELAQDRETCEYGDELSGSIKCGEFVD